VDHRYLAFVGVAALLLITPGVDMALVTRNALRYGRRAAFWTALGIDSGVVVWTLAAAAGIAGALRASATAFTALKLLGAAYLFYLGARTLWLSFRGAPAGHVSTEHSSTPPALELSARGAFRQGILSNLLNPKIAVFFTSFLPQFIKPTESAARQSLILGGIHITMSLIWLLSYALAAGTLAGLLRRPRLAAALDRLTAVVLIAFGLRLATERR
jgi:threonine/homoserine/homoserine lactone efflux protein